MIGTSVQTLRAHKKTLVHLSVSALKGGKDKNCAKKCCSRPPEVASPLEPIGGLVGNHLVEHVGDVARPEPGVLHPDVRGVGGPVHRLYRHAVLRAHHELVLEEVSCVIRIPEHPRLGLGKTVSAICPSHKLGVDLLLAGLVAVLAGGVGDAILPARVELERLGQLDLTRFPALQQRHLTNVDIII